MTATKHWNMKYAKLLLFVLCMGLSTGATAQQSALPSIPDLPAPPPDTPSTTENDETTEGQPAEDLVYLNVQDADIQDIIKQISKATQRNFILDDKIRGKVTIMSERPMTREEAYQTFLSALEVAGYTVVSGPAGVLKVVALRDAVREPIPTHVDTTPLTSSYVTRLISLQSISAIEMSNAIKGLISKDGNLFAYPSTNTLIITDSGVNIDRLMKIIKELDQEGPQEVMEIIPIQNAQARDVAQIVTSLFAQANGARAPTRAKKGDLEEEDTVSKVIADERTNSVIVLASKRSIESVKSVIRRLDAKVGQDRDGKIHVYYLKHAKAKELAETLSTLTAAAGKAPASAAKKAGGTDIVVAEFEGGIKIAADEPTNSLIITATSLDFQTLIDKVISKLDVPRRQVYLEASIMELTIKNGSNIGFSAHGGGAAGAAGIGFGNTFGAATGLTSAFAGGAPLLGGLISRQTVEINMIGANNELQTVSVPAFSAFISALSSYSDANVISSPNVLTLDNQEAVIEVTRSEPRPGAQTITASNIGQSQPVEYEEAGLKLKITPQIGDGNSVRLVINQELSNFEDARQTQLQAPAKVKRQISTTVVTHNGQTVVLGGLMEDLSGSKQTKVPILGSIPLLGFFFRHTEKSMQKTNMLVFITPHVVNNTDDFQNILKNKIEERNKFIDLNYGKKQRKAIRESITNNRADLLEFKKGDTTEPQAIYPTNYIAGSSVEGAVGQVPTPVESTVATSAAATQPRTTSGSAPVITAQPPPTPSATSSVPSTATKTPAWVPTPPPAGAPAPGARGSGSIDLQY